MLSVMVLSIPAKVVQFVQGSCLTSCFRYKHSFILKMCGFQQEDGEDLGSQVVCDPRVIRPVVNAHLLSSIKGCTVFGHNNKYSIVFWRRLAWS